MARTVGDDGRPYRQNNRTTREINDVDHDRGTGLANEFPRIVSSVACACARLPAQTGTRRCFRSCFSNWRAAKLLTHCSNGSSVLYGFTVQWQTRMMLKESIVIV